MAGDAPDSDGAVGEVVCNNKGAVESALRGGVGATSALAAADAAALIDGL